MMFRTLIFILGCSSSLMAAPILSDNIELQQIGTAQNGSPSLKTNTNDPSYNKSLEAKRHSHSESSHHDKHDRKPGPMGPKGATGATGAAGPTGATGVVAQSYGRLYASSSIQGETITITNPINNLPLPPGDWQPLPVDTFSPSLIMTAITPTNGTITVGQAGTYLINASLSIRQNGSGAAGGTCGIGYLINGTFQNSNAAFITVPLASSGPVYSCNFNDLVQLSAGDVVEFILAGNETISENIQLITADASIVQVGN